MYVYVLLYGNKQSKDISQEYGPQRLRRMAATHRRWDLLCFFTGALAMILDALRVTYLETPTFALWQIAMAVRVMIGFGDEGSVALSPFRVLQSILPGSLVSNPTKSVTQVGIDDAESTDVGTLGS
jgi:hypothetical protein